MKAATGAAGILALSVALSVGGGAATSTRAWASNPDTPTKRHRDPVHKFSFMRFDDWKQIPLAAKSQDAMFEDPLEKWMAAKFVERNDLGRRFSAGSLEIYRMGKGAETTGPKPPPGVRVFGRDEPKTMEDLLKQVLERMGGGLLDPKGMKDFKSKDGVPGRMWEIERKDRGVFMVLAAWRKDDAEVGMWMAVESVLRKKYELGFERIVRSFRWFDEQAEDVRSIDALAGLPISARKKREIEKGLVTGWDVIVSPNKNYIVIYNKKGRRNDALAKVLAERIEAIRAQVYELQFPSAQPVKAVSVVRICGDAFEYYAYGGPRGSAGYWSSDTEELVFFDMDEKKGVADDDTLAVCYHEAFHQYIYYSVGSVAPHSWFNEGHGDYYAGSRFSDGKFQVKPFRWRVGVVKEAIKNGPSPYEEKSSQDGGESFKFDRESRGYSPLKALTRMSQGEYYSYPSVSYAQGWSLVYFLREIVPKNKEYSAKWGAILATYFRVLKEEVNKEKPLKPKVDEPDDGDEGGMDEPGMGDAGMDEPGMGDPGMGEPGMGGDAGMDEPGMGDPGMGDEPPPPGGDDDDAPAIPRFLSMMGYSEKALRAAVREAFTGVDFDELEAAWKKEIMKIPTPPKRKR